MSATQKPIADKQTVHCNFTVPKIAYVTAANAAVGAICSVFVYVINPIGGAVFGTVHCLMHTLLQPGYKSVMEADEQFISKVYVYAASFFTSAVVAAAAATAIGFSMPIIACLMVAGLMLPASLAIDFIFKSLFQKEEVKK